MSSAKDEAKNEKQSNSKYKDCIESSPRNLLMQFLTQSYSNCTSFELIE